MQTIALDSKAEDATTENEDEILSHETHESRIVPTKRSWLQRSFVILGLMSFGVAMGWYLRAGAETDERIKLETAALSKARLADSIPISTSTVSYRKLKRYIDAIGSIHGFEDLTVAAKSEGRVLRIYHDMSDVVNPNALLLEIDPTDMQLAMNQAERALTAECERWGFEGVPGEGVDLERLPAVRTAKMRLELAQSKLTRLSVLFKTNSISADEFEQIKSDARIAESDWDNQRHLARSSLATIRLRESELNITRQRLKDTQVFAPIPTTETSQEDRVYCIARRLVSVGSFVRPGDPLLRLVLGRSVKVRLTLQECHSASVVVGQTVEIENAVGGLAATGEVTRVSPVIDPVNRTFIVEVSVLNEQGQLKPGGFARARIQVGKDVVAMTIPLSALETFAGVNKVIAIADGVATEHQVRLGYQQDDWIEITEPLLPEGTLLATSSQRLLSTGVSVVDRDVDKAAP